PVSYNESGNPAGIAALPVEGNAESTVIMTRPPAPFEQIVGDTEAFRLMLDGALKDFISPYLVWLPDAGQFLSGREYHAALGAFFGLLFGHPHGERLYRAQAESMASRLEESSADSLTFTCEVT